MSFLKKAWRYAPAALWGTLSVGVGTAGFAGVDAQTHLKNLTPAEKKVYYMNEALQDCEGSQECAVKKAPKLFDQHLKENPEGIAAAFVISAVLGFAAACSASDADNKNEIDDWEAALRPIPQRSPE